MVLTENARGTLAGCPFQDKTEADQYGLLQSYLLTFQHYFGNFSDAFKGVPDPRYQPKVTYPLASLFFTGCLLFICRLGARRQINTDFRNNDPSMAKFKALFDVDNAPHGDTLDHTFRQLDVNAVQEVVCRLIEKLIRKKVFYPYRLRDRYVMIAIDGTGMLTFRQRHCERCLTRTLRDGSVLYYHPVLEAKLVTANGFALSIMTEFIENPGENPDKQDCELTAFYRLAARLKARFPRLPICVLLDGLFACGPVLQMCRDNHWQHMIVLKDNDLPSVNEEFEALWPLEPANKLTYWTGKKKEICQNFRWVNEIVYVDSDRREHVVSVLECVETKPGKDGTTVTNKFKWLTFFKLTEKNVIEFANTGGRLRWKIENEGFNVQKNGGFGLEHAYSENEVSAKVFYFLLQIAHMLFQLMAKGSLFKKVFPKGVGSLKKIAERILEAWRNLRIQKEQLIEMMNIRVRISFYDSS